MIRISHIKIAAGKAQASALEQEIKRALRLKSLQGISYHIRKKSVDARKKESIFCIYTVDQLKKEIIRRYAKDVWEDKEE